NAFFLPAQFFKPALKLNRLLPTEREMPMCVIERHGVQQGLKMLSLLLGVFTFLMGSGYGQQRVELRLCLFNRFPAGIQFVEVRTQPIMNEICRVRTFEHVPANERIDVAYFFDADGLIKNFQSSFARNSQPGTKC